MAKDTEKPTTSHTGEIILYRSPDGKASLDVHLERETVWLNQRQMAELFDKDTDTIGLHIRNIYKEGELTRKGTTEESSVVQNEGGRQVRRKVGFYNLDVIISVGYRVKSKRGTQFRIWATNVLLKFAKQAVLPCLLDQVFSGEVQKIVFFSKRQIGMRHMASKLAVGKTSKLPSS